MSENAVSCVEQSLTLSQCCLEILNHLPEMNAGRLHDFCTEKCLFDLQRGVSRLKYWSSCSDDDKYTLKQVMMIYKIAAENAMTAFVKRTDTTDGGSFATILKIVSEILSNLTTPDTAVIRCLQFLQELHDLPVIKLEFTSLIKESLLFVFKKRFPNVLTVHKINKILFKFVRMFVKPPPTVEEWPATIRLNERVYNPLIEEQFLKEKLAVNRVFSSQIELDIDNVIGTDENVEGQNTDVLEYKESDVGTSGNRYTTSATDMEP